MACSFLMEYDIHTILDGLTLVATVWVIYELRVTLKSTYQAEQDNVQAYYVVSCRTTQILFMAYTGQRCHQ